MAIVLPVARQAKTAVRTRSRLAAASDYGRESDVSLIVSGAGYDIRTPDQVKKDTTTNQAASSGKCTSRLGGASLADAFEEQMLV